MGDDHSGPPAPRHVQRLLDDALRGRVERRRRLVEEEQLRLPNQRACDGDALLLPAAELRPPLAAEGVVALWKNCSAN